MSGTNDRRGAGRMTRTLLATSLALFLLATVVLVVVVNYFGGRSPFRFQIDATKTRAYSLSDQTRNLLDGLEGEWTIGLVMIEQEIDRSTLRQIDEVLNRFRQAVPGISVVRLDPTEASSLDEYERLLGDLRLLYADLIAAYDTALDEGAAAFADLQAFAQTQAGGLQQMVQLIPADDPDRATLQQRVGLLALLAREGGKVLAEVERARRIDDARPIPDYETARSILAEALSQWANELFDSARRMEGWLQAAETDEALRRYASGMHGDYEATARHLAERADPLRRLPPLELSRIGRQLEGGEAAIVMGPRGATVIPSTQLFPRLNLRQGEDGSVTFDQRFRGEQLIAAAIRSLTVDQMPLVVFVHAGDRPLTRADERQADLVGMATNLSAARFDVVEWIVTAGERPVPRDGQPAVWIVLPSPRAGTETPGEPELIAATNQLLAEGEPVMLSLYPSLVSRFGQPDPWAAVTRPLGVTVDSGHVIYERVTGAQQSASLLRGQSINEFTARHPIARAINGQQAYFGLPMGVTLDPSSDAPSREVIVAIEPAPDRWLERDWLTPLTDQSVVPEAGEPFDERVPLVVGVERPHPDEGGTQRCLVVGSGGWMLSNVADIVVNVGGERVALINPGNVELGLASVAWLAGMDELIAASPMSQEVARLQGITDGVRRTWFWVTLVLVPGLCAAMGLVVSVVRRR